ncbi:hypothetical protein EQG79_30170 [Spirosoma sordidisoli]|uniref:Uncharacterized protein n=1 Tax=Spirosoma sordidisoli TaxID=2502893 RepID=A0A4Q2UDN4_9BACT|nr:hypothetical protein EQG79_30170 [Spirosoma sordidisoli]
MAEPTPEPVAQPPAAETPPAPLPLFRRLPHLLPVLFALSMIAAWYGCAAWYNNLSRYIVPAADTLGDFRILYLKKAVGALLPCLSSLVASMGLLVVLNFKFYFYINGWTAKDFDFSTDLRQLDRTDALRRVLVFVGLFALFFLAFLYFFTLSPQELTL